MKYSLLFFTVLVVSGNAFASVACENKLTEHFKKLDINPSEMRDTNDYSNPRLSSLGKKAHGTTTKDELTKMLKEAKKYGVKDSRANEAIRVCSAISAFARAGVSGKDIEMKTLSFQNGWSGSMREPLAALIKEEIEGLGKDSSNMVAGTDVSFCSPDANERNCSTPDGRVYMLQTNVNQLQRGLAKEKVQATPSKTDEGSAIQK